MKYGFLFTLLFYLHTTVILIYELLIYEWKYQLMKIFIYFMKINFINEITFFLMKIYPYYLISYMYCTVYTTPHFDYNIFSVAMFFFFCRCCFYCCCYSLINILWHTLCTFQREWLITICPKTTERRRKKTVARGLSSHENLLGVIEALAEEREKGLPSIVKFPGTSERRSR